MPDLDRIEAVLNSDAMVDEPAEWVAHLLALLAVARAAERVAAHPNIDHVSHADYDALHAALARLNQDTT